MTTTTALAFAGGRIRTMAPGPAPEVLVVADGLVAAVGPPSLLDAWPDARRVDLEGRTLVPGFIDAHSHLSLAALHPRWADLSAVADPGELGRALADQAAREPEADWVRGVGWERSGHWKGPLTRHELDALGLDRPIIVGHFSLHMCVVCSRGLDALGIGRGSVDPEGGVIVRGPDGEPTGLLIERAWSQAQERSLAAYADPDRWGDHLLARMRLLLREGVTAVHDATTSPAAEEAYRRLARRGALPLSVLALPHPAAILSGPARQRLEGPPTGEGDAWLRVGPIKLFADGGSHPAIDARRQGERFTAGIAFAGLSDDVVAATSRGFRVAVHAMGNAGLEATLDAFTAAARADDAEHRFRVEHVTLASPGQLRRLAGLGGVGVVQPGFLQVVGSRVLELAFDDDVTWMPFADLVAAGVPLAASSDHPCGEWEPLTTSSLGVTRSTGRGVLGPGQALGYEDWLRAWTAGAAFAGGQEDERGTLQPGRRADLVVLDGPLDPEHPPRVAETWVAGRRVHPGPLPTP